LISSSGNLGPNVSLSSDLTLGIGNLTPISLNTGSTILDNLGLADVQEGQRRKQFLNSGIYEHPKAGHAKHKNILLTFKTSFKILKLVDI
jgi:hypothetical protein